MNKKGQASVLITAGIGVVIAVIVISIVANLVFTQTGSTDITDDQFVASNTTCTKITDNCILAGSYVVENATSGADRSTNFSICTSGGEPRGLLLIDTTTSSIALNGQTLNATYDDVSCNRITGFASTIVNYIPLLLAVAVLITIALLIKT